MSDRELLELAAKAAGIEGNWVGGVFNNFVKTCKGYQMGWWNPLIDDGDALRLAVKLKILVDTALAHKGAPDDNCDCPMHRTEPYAATRRAIVCAAAEIGKGMK